jgi:hypothetical protein
MTYQWSQIVEAVRLMQSDQGPLFQRMRDILIRYEGEWVMPMVDLKNEPKMPQLTPALVGEAIDQIALRASSVAPTIFSPPMQFNKDRGKGSRAYGATRAQIINATYEQSRWSLGRRRYYRHLTAYHTAAIVVIPDMVAKMPRIEVRDPLSSYVEPMANESLRDPNYACFVTRHSGAFLRDRFPKTKSENGGPIGTRDVTGLWDIVEWYDHEDVVWGLLGPCETQTQTFSTNHMYNTTVAPDLELARLHNYAEMPPVCVPHNVSLGRIASRIGSLLGNIDLQAKMMALNIVAQEKAIFPDTWVIGSKGSEPKLVHGEWKDGRSGEVNIIEDADAVGVLRSTPDPTTGQLIDRLERNFRTSTSLVPQLGGETYGALRTGRGIDALSSMALDPRVQELHEVTEAYLPMLNRGILATYTGYWPSKKYSMYCGYANNRKLVEFVPSEHIETLENSVSYYISGADVMQLTQVLGSLYGAKAISRQTFQEQHPMIGNADAEAAQTREEELEAAVMAGLTQQVMTGALPPTILAMVAKKLKDGLDVFSAVELIDTELRKLQATPAPPPEEGMTAAPETMPGLTGGPAADQQPGAAPEIAPPANAGAMRQVMAAMSQQGAG